MKNSDQIWDLVDAHAAPLVALSDDVWEVPELNFGEFKSCALHASALENEGFAVTRDVAGLPTAVMGEAGEGGPIIAFLGEFDALPNLSNAAGVTEHAPLPGSGNGHACGHNLLGSAALLAATAVKSWLAANNVPGRVRYYGCPAEEGGAGKSFMVRAGVFDGVDAAVSWHPLCFAGVFPPNSLANIRIDFTFTGKAAHAAAAPHLGRSALDAAELLNVGVNYLREHMLPTSRIHYAYLDAGGVAPNVVQSKVVIRYTVRALELGDMMALADRVRKVADGAAMMTETSVSAEIISGMANLLPCPPLERAMHANLERLGPPPFDDADRAFALEMQKTFPREDILSAFRAVGLPPAPDEPLCASILPLATTRMSLGSTDVGDVSWTVPTVQALGATCAVGTQLHSWQMTAQGKSSVAHKGMIHVAKVMAMTAIDLLTDETLLTRAKADHADRLRVQPYISPIPADVQPPVRQAPDQAA
ncbi:aminobenzoyl-glutamate utilization protein [Acetobacter nitrogenifigens DSM 23921 = NBRC 105050]|uniref:Peptidase M20 n=1 Tax=Acetobacter nitrogenifigens DSM 23921 = NBRC 105050 TaxID=1120919 RepID=A0A511X9K5_9PROT|nr:amidohydrolase [Acetobacter nitrogenifigens]GBQ93659.1 aminobenzoyl-glutamate utilization protein [Acetobacter nitrogenifigens DSM 23921 = NBRC 105050]GEN59636.1 peptidase M20 [Acetobacter nitrogenifigens DSM 23921 = NBRC 105050]